MGRKCGKRKKTKRGLGRFFSDKKSRLSRVCGIVRDDGACGYYRVVLPFEKIQYHGYADAALGGIGRSSDLFRIMSDSDLIVLPRPASRESYETIKICKEEGKKIVVDHDDDIFNVNPMSPHYISSGTKEVEVVIGGEKVKLWEDGKENNGEIFDLQKNIEKMEMARECLKLADAVSVTTERLGRAYEEYNKNILIHPNCVDTAIWQKLPLKEHDGLRIIWSGGVSHYQDWLTISDRFRKLMAHNMHWKFLCCGHEFTGLFRDIDKSQYEFHKWVPTPAHPYKQAILGADISVIPLKKDQFNACKSPIKFVEYAAIGVPSICSNWPPYSDVITDGVNGFLYDTEDDFEEKLIRLASDRELRQEMGENARQYVMDNYDIDSKADIWGANYAKLIRGDKCL